MRVSLETIRAISHRWSGSHAASVARGFVGRQLAALSEAIQAWEPLFWLIAVLAATVILPFRLEIGQNADGLLLTLMSLEHLTVFFWEQDRFANLLPLLTHSITDPTVNAEAQLAIRIIGGLLAPLLFCVPLMRDDDYPRMGRVVLLATSLTLAFAPYRFLHECFIEASPYGTSFALGGIALLLFNLAQARSGSAAVLFRFGGLLLTLAAYMVNASLLLFTGPLFVLLAATTDSRLVAEFGIASVVAMLTTLTIANSVAVPHTELKFGETLIGVRYYLGEFSGRPGHFLWATFAIYVTAITTAITMRLPTVRSLAHYGAILIATFVAAFFAISLSSWVIINYMHPRYLVPLYLLAASLGAISIQAFLDGAIASAYLRSRVTLCLITVVLLVAGQRSLPPVPQYDGIVHVSSRALAYAAANELTRLNLDGVAGEYWTVWPTIFVADQLAHDQGLRLGKYFGASDRGAARREALQARLIAQRSLDFGCLDLPDEACRTLITDTIGLKLAVTQPPISHQSLGNGHEMTVLRLFPVTSDVARNSSEQK